MLRVTTVENGHCYDLLKIIKGWLVYVDSLLTNRVLYFHTNTLKLQQHFHTIQSSSADTEDIPFVIGANFLMIKMVCYLIASTNVGEVRGTNIVVY